MLSENRRWHSNDISFSWHYQPPSSVYKNVTKQIAIEAKSPEKVLPMAISVFSENLCLNSFHNL